MKVIWFVGFVRNNELQSKTHCECNRSRGVVDVSRRFTGYLIN